MRSPEVVRNRAAAGLVLGLHLALLVAWWDHQSAPRPRDPTTSASRATWLRLLPLAETPRDTATTADSRPRRPDGSWPPVQPITPQAPRLPVPDKQRSLSATGSAQDRESADPPGSDPSAGGSAVLPAPVRPPSLDLRLPPPELRGRAPPGHRTAPAEVAVESKIARGLAAGPLIEEDLGQGRRRFRQGTRCVDVREARMSQIDPFNQSVAGIPKQVEDCRR